MAHENGVLNAVFTADGKKAISVGYAQEVRFWDLETGKKILGNTDHRAGVRGLSLFPDGKRVATAGFDGTVRLLDVGTGKQVLLCKTTHAQPGSSPSRPTASASPRRGPTASSCCTTRRPATW